MQLLPKTLSSRSLLALTILAGLGLSIAPRAASAQNLLFTLDGVTFEDGATASGSFNYDSTQNVFGAYDITTMSNDTQTGDHYLGPIIGQSNQNAQLDSAGRFVFSADYGHKLYLDTFSPATSSGTFGIIPGYLDSDNNLFLSGEILPNDEIIHTITAGNLIVTDPSAVPEPSASASFAVGTLMLAGLAVVAGRRRTRGNKKAAEVASA